MSDVPPENQISESDLSSEPISENPPIQADFLSRTESRLMTHKLRCCKGKVADITGSGMRMLVSPKDLPEIGDIQEYTFSDQTAQLTVTGTVKWVRKGTAFTRRCEVGVEFAKLDPHTRDAIIKLAVTGEMGLTKEGNIQVGYPDLYKLLGITQYATQEDIEKAYRTEAKVWHPDHNSASNAAECFDQIRKAYSVLSDQDLRAKYDARFFNQGQQAA